jgi:hypothetical protein
MNQEIESLSRKLPARCLGSRVHHIPGAPEMPSSQSQTVREGRLCLVIASALTGMGISPPRRNCSARTVIIENRAIRRQGALRPEELKRSPSIFFICWGSRGAGGNPLLPDGANLVLKFQYKCHARLADPDA